MSTREESLKRLKNKFTIGYCLFYAKNDSVTIEEYSSIKNDGTTVIFKTYKSGGFDVLKSCKGGTINDLENFLKEE